MIRESVSFHHHKRPLSSAIRSRRQSSIPSAISPELLSLPFLHETATLFTASELTEVSNAMESPERELRPTTPSRLMEIKTFQVAPTGSRTPTLTKSVRPPGIISPIIQKGSDLEREDSIISLVDEFETATARGMAKMQLTGQLTSLSNAKLIGPAVTSDDLRPQVWIYAHDRIDSSDTGKIKEFPHEIVGREAFTCEKGGRKRVVDAIRKTPHSAEEKIWTQKEPDELLTEKSYCAREVREFLTKKHWPQPRFLQESLSRDRTASMRRRAHR
jgi:hypothetical protein